MALEHGSSKWKLYGGGAEVTKLPKNRYAVTLRCLNNDFNEDWYHKNKDEIWKEFGDAYSLPLNESGVPSDWTPLDGEEYPNLVLVDTKYRYPQGLPTPILEFNYETLTDTWTVEDDDDVSSTPNGLRVLERREVAIGGTALPYNENNIGSSTITDGGKTLYLSAFSDEGGEQKGVVVSRWAEAGTLRVRRTDVGDGRFKVTYEFLGQEGSTSGPIVDRNIGNFEGFRTIIVTTEQRANGASLIGFTTTSEIEIDFDYPGEVSVGEATGSLAVSAGFNGSLDTINFNDYRWVLNGPQTNVPITATRTIEWKSTSDLVLANPRYVPPSARGSIAGLSVRSLGVFLNPGAGDYQPPPRDVTFNGYTAVAPLSATGTGVIEEVGRTLNVTTVEGAYKVGPWSMTLTSRGSGKPDGNTYTLSAEAPLAFIDLDGNEYYKHEIITATIPVR